MFCPEILRRKEELSEMSRVDHALSLFQKRDSCSQAILATYAEQYGLDEKTALKIAEVFSGGIAARGNICGALNGALMVIGLHYGGKKDPSAIYCRELIHFDLTTPENQKLAYEKKVFRNCPEFVGSTVELLEEVLE